MAIGWPSSVSRRKAGKPWRAVNACNAAQQRGAASTAAAPPKPRRSTSVCASRWRNWKSNTPASSSSTVVSASGSNVTDRPSAADMTSDSSMRPRTSITGNGEPQAQGSAPIVIWSPMS